MKTAQTQIDLLPTQTSELVHGLQMISRIRELQAQGMIVLRMKCEKENGIYEIGWIEDSTKNFSAPD